MTTALACQNNTIDLDPQGGDIGGSADDDDDDDDDDSPADATTGGPMDPTNVSTTGSPPNPTTVSTTLPGSASSPPDPPFDTGADDPPFPTDFGIPPGIPSASGTYLLAISTFLSPGVPFQALVNIESNGDTLDIEFQWLSLDIGSTTSPREPVGDVYTYANIEPLPDGGFVWPMGVVLIPGPANPISGSDVVISALVDAVPQADPYCGEVSGEIIEPVMTALEGTTHAMTEVFDPGALPVEFAASCP